MDPISGLCCCAALPFVLAFVALTWRHWLGCTVTVETWEDDG